MNLRHHRGPRRLGAVLAVTAAACAPLTPPAPTGGLAQVPPTPATVAPLLVRQAERLDRGAVAVPRAAADGGGRLLTWRRLASDSPDTRYTVWRDGQQLNSTALSATQWLDTGPAPTGAAAPRYQVLATQGGRTESPAPAHAALVLDGPAWTVPLDTPADWTGPDGRPVRYQANDGAPADLDGDGRYEIVLKWQPENARDNAQPGLTAPTLIDAYRLDGMRLWRIDLGPNIRSGAHYTPFVVYDFDGDGRAELMLRTADGTVDGRGQVQGNARARHANAQGRVLSGPEWLSVFDGRSGALLATTPYLPERGAVADWGDGYGNRVDRFLAGVAYLDGQRPSAVFSRGYYTRAVLAAWDWRGGQLRQRWVFDSAADAASAPASGQGAHWFAVADVDADGHDDIVYGAATIGHDGRLNYSTGLGHGDALHVGRLDPTRPGLQVFMVHENPRAYGPHGIEMHDAATGQLLWSHSGEGRDVGRGICLDIDARQPGSECWASVGPLLNARGQTLSGTRPRATNFGLWWDGSLQRSTLDKLQVARWDLASGQAEVLLDGAAQGAAANNGSKATPVFTADLLGDWREELVWRRADNRALLVYTSPWPTAHRRTTLMHDLQYRVQVAAQNAGYNSRRTPRSGSPTTRCRRPA